MTSTLNRRAGESPAPADDPHWRLSARCQNADPELFAPSGGLQAKPPRAAVEASNRYCHPCPVQRQCREWANDLEHEAVGLWGRQWRFVPKCRMSGVVVVDIPAPTPRVELDPIQPRTPPPLTQTQQAVLDAVGVEPTPRADVIAASGQPQERARQTLGALAKRGLVTSPRWGMWVRVPEPSRAAS